MPAPPRILWIAPSWLGDAVLSLPALQWLLAQGPEVEVLARHGTERLFATDTVVVHGMSPGARTRRFGAAWRLRSRSYAAAAVLPPSLSAALLATVTGARWRIGERAGGRSALLTHALPPAGRAVHLALAYRRIAAATWTALQPESRPSDPATDLGCPELKATSEEIHTAATLFGSRGIADPAVLVIAPGARFGPAKRYPAAAFAAAATAAASRYRTPIVLVGGAADAATNASVAQLLPGAIDLTGRTSLPALIGLLATARGVISNDSGVMHLAAALGTPVVGIFGSTNPAWTRPLGRRATYVVHPVPCAPCYRRTCPIDFPCMHGIAPERVVEALDAVLATDRPGGREAASPLCSQP